MENLFCFQKAHIKIKHTYLEMTYPGGPWQYTCTSYGLHLAQSAGPHLFPSIDSLPQCLLILISLQNPLLCKEWE